MNKSQKNGTRMSQTPRNTEEFLLKNLMGRHMLSMRMAIFCALVSPFVFVGCASRQALFTMPSVSMTETAPVRSKMGTELGPVSTSFCSGDQATSAKGNSVGLIDEVIAKAQKEKNASFIKNAQFFQNGSCIELEGVAVK